MVDIVAGRSCEGCGMCCNLLKIDSLNKPRPARELILLWLRENMPAPGRIALVHGDFRTGNFMIDASIAAQMRRPMNEAMKNPTTKQNAMPPAKPTQCGKRSSRARSYSCS